MNKREKIIEMIKSGEINIDKIVTETNSTKNSVRYYMSMVKKHGYDFKGVKKQLIND